MATVESRGRVSNRYLDLIQTFPLRPIQTDKELDEAINVVDLLVSRQRLTDPERDYLAVLSGLVEQYESKAYPTISGSDASMLRHLIESRGVTQTALAAKTGIVPSTISAVVNGRRRLNRANLAKVAAYFNVPPTVFAYPEQAGES